MTTKIFTHSDTATLVDLVNAQINLGGWAAMSGVFLNRGGHWSQIVTDEFGDGVRYDIAQAFDPDTFQVISASFPGLPLGVPQLMGGGLVTQSFGGLLADITPEPSYTLPVATPTVLGGVKSGTVVTVDGSGNMTLAAATASVIGGVKSGAVVTVDGAGAMSVHGLLTRVKSECWFTGLSLVIPTTATNLINLIKALSHTGSLAPFFNTTTNKLNVSNFNTSVDFKVNFIGTWSGASTNRSLTVDFPQTNGNSLTKTRDAAVTTDQMSLSTFFSVDLGGNLATNGSDITVVANGATFAVSAILLIAEQLIPS